MVTLERTDRREGSHKTVRRPQLCTSTSQSEWAFLKVLELQWVKFLLAFLFCEAFLQSPFLDVLRGKIVLKGLRNKACLFVEPFLARKDLPWRLHRGRCWRLRKKEEKKFCSAKIWAIRQVIALRKKGNNTTRKKKKRKKETRLAWRGKVLCLLCPNQPWGSDKTKNKYKRAKGWVQVKTPRVESGTRT